MKFRQVLSFVIAVATLASCNKEEISDNVSTNFVLKASVENSTVSTRAGFDSGAKFYWSKNDKLGVTTTNSKTQFTALTLQGDGGAASGTFSGDIYGSVEGYAVYPHSRSHNLDNATLTYQFPANYSYSSVDTEYFHATDQGKANSFNFAMWGKIQNGSVGMKHLGGVFMVAFTSIPAEGTFILSADQKINGTYSVDLTAGTPEIKIDADYTPTDAEKEVVITFANATEGQTGVFYVPAPTGNYTGVTATLLNAEGEIVKEVACGDVVIKRAYGKILNFTNGSIVGGGTAEVKNVVAANVALENENITSVKIAEVSASDAITIPAKSASEIASTPHTIDLSNANLPVEGITINVTEGSAGTETVEHLTVIVPSGTEATGNLNINAPGTTVTIEAVNGTVIDIIEAITAENTLVIGEGVTVKTLKIIGGNVRINGTVEKIFDANDNEYTLVTSVDALTQAISGDKSHVILGADIQSTNIITINKAFTLNGNGYTLTSTASRAINVETTGTVTINNLNIVAGERAVNIINKAATVNLNNVTATAKNNAVMIATSAGAVKLAVNKCDFTGLAVINVAGAGSQVTITDTKITNVDATEAEDYGAITVWTSAAGASVKVEGGEIKVADDSRKAWIFPNDATVEGVDDIGYINYLVGDAGYDTFEEAIKDVKDGGTIELVRDIAASEIITINKPVTINGNGVTLTSTAPRAINVETTGTVTINNLNIVAGERAVNIINKAATVNLNNVTATAKNNALMIATSAGAVKLAVNKCDFTGLAVINVAGAGSQVTITDTKITNVDATEAEDYGAITVWTSAAGASVKVEGGEIKVADDSRKAWIFPDDATVEGVDDIGYINYLVDDAGFDTFEEAIKEAKSGAKIRLARNIELNSYLTISEDVTLNLNGKNITASGCALYVNGGTLTIEGEGTVIGSSGNNNNQPAVWAATNGAVVINGGTYNVGSDGSGKTNDCIYANGGVITIYAGTFSNTGTYDPSAGGVVINANNKKESSKVIINGGTFNPAEGCVAYEQQDVDEGRVVVNK